MKYLLALILTSNLLACVANLPSDVAQTEPDAAEKPAAENRSDTPHPAKPAKSPHGYIITKDSDPGRFGGFIGDCSDDRNWPYYWECMSENSGNGFK
jgi:hypothetical protein